MFVSVLGVGVRACEGIGGERVHMRTRPGGRDVVLICGQGGEPLCVLTLPRVSPAVWPGYLAPGLWLLPLDLP